MDHVTPVVPPACLSICMHGCLAVLNSHGSLSFAAHDNMIMIHLPVAPSISFRSTSIQRLHNKTQGSYPNIETGALPRGPLLTAPSRDQYLISYPSDRRAKAGASAQALWQ